MTALLLALAVLIGFPHRSAPARLARLFAHVPPSRRAAQPRSKRLRWIARGSSGWSVPGPAPNDHAPPDASSPPWRRVLLAALSAGALTYLTLGFVACVVAAVVAGWAIARLARGKPPRVDSASMAATWDLFAACLTAGMPVPGSIRAVAADLPGQPGRTLRNVADLLALGADPIDAWATALDCPETAALARGARRTARSGAALAGVARDLAADVRARAADDAEARAQRAAVLVNGPLALCFLPAFLCLGIAPVVLGMADVLSNQL
ncbi:MAG TPA: type II secretion system F family protein [Actinokineospora sp.]|jgi:pilus assembly protein TadC|nr:type II secretion system F family protein [Actinokineospora sp.]